MTMLNIYQRMNNIMKSDTYIKKREKKAGMQYSFASHDDVSAMASDVLTANGVAFIPTVNSYTVSENKQKTNFKGELVIESKHQIHVKACFVNIDKPEERIDVEGWGYALDDADKGYGKALSYAIKYMLMKTFLIPTGDEEPKGSDEIDSYQEKTTSKPKPIEAAQPMTLNKEQIENIRSLISDYPEIVKDITKSFGKSYIKDIEYNKYSQVLAMVQMLLKQEGVA